MKILPVLDIAAGVTVHAAGGDRARYRPVESLLTRSADPRAVAAAFRERLGLEELYLADLDAIAGGEPQWEIIRALVRDGFALMVDAGARDRHRALGLREAGVRTVVAGIETLEGPEHLPDLVEGLGAGALVLGLDLRDGRPIGDPRAWGPRDAASIAAAAFARGVRRFLVLDLARIGSGAGPLLGSIRSVRERSPAAEVLAGGGVRGVDDLRELDRLGVRGTLVATALHRGAIGRSDLASLRDR